MVERLAQDRTFHMADTLPHVLIRADDRALAHRLAAAVLRLGYPGVLVLPLADHDAVTSGTSLDTPLVTVLGLSSAADVELGLERAREGRAAGRTSLAALAPAGPEMARAAEGLAALVPVVLATDDVALAQSIRDAIHAPAAVSDRERVWELQILHDIAQVAARSLEPDAFVASALERLVPAVGATAGSVRLRNESTGAYETRAEIRSDGNQTCLACLEAATAQVIATGAAVLSEDLGTGESSGRPGWRGAVSVACVPMLVDEALIGTVGVTAPEPGRFGPAHGRLFAAVAGQMARAVRNGRLQDILRRGKRDWENTFDAISDAIAVFDSRGQLLRGNSALASFLGRAVTELLPATCDAVGLCDGAFPACAVGTAAAYDAAGRSELTASSGQIFSVTTFPVTGDPDGPSVVQVAKNVTEEIRIARRLHQMTDELGTANGRLTATVRQLKSTQAQLLQSEKLSAIGQLVAGVAHELNNPLTSVIGYAQLLEDEILEGGTTSGMGPRPELAQDVRRIVQEAERAARIVRNLLAFARRQAAERGPQDITDLVARVLSLRTYDLRLDAVSLETAYEPGLPPIIADASQIQQALLNLILNAEQALRGRERRVLRVCARFDEPASAVELLVSDTGHGIEETNLTRIFDPFFTTREVGEGTGLGLSICYGIVRDHGGQIHAESSVNVGTTVTVQLPARPEGPAMSDDPILVAHPDKADLDFIAAALLAWGYAVACTTDAEEALHRYQAGGLHALLLNRGFIAGDPAAWGAARAADVRQVPVVLLSRTSDDCHSDPFRPEGGSTVLTAPFQLRALRSALRAATQEYA